MKRHHEYLKNPEEYLSDNPEIRSEGFKLEDIPYWLYVTRFRSDTIELTRRNWNAPVKIKPEWTLAVYAARFDLEGLGTVDLLPVEVNDELPDKLAEIDNGQARKGLYRVNGKQMTLFVPASPLDPRPAEIPLNPKSIRPGEVVLIIERREPLNIVGSVVGRGKVNIPLNMNYEFTPAESDYVLPAGKSLLQQIGALTEPVKFEYPRTEDKRIFVYRKPNGWIVQTEVPEPEYPHQFDNMQDMLRVMNTGVGSLRLKPDFEPLRPGEKPFVPN